MMNAFLEMDSDSRVVDSLESQRRAARASLLALPVNPDVLDPALFDDQYLDTDDADESVDSTSEEDVSDDDEQEEDDDDELEEEKENSEDNKVKAEMSTQPSSPSSPPPPSLHLQDTTSSQLPRYTHDELDLYDPSYPYSFPPSLSSSSTYSSSLYDSNLNYIHTPEIYDPSDSSDYFSFEDKENEYPTYLEEVPIYEIPPPPGAPLHTPHQSYTYMLEDYSDELPSSSSSIFSKSSSATPSSSKPSIFSSPTSKQNGSSIFGNAAIRKVIKVRPSTIRNRYWRDAFLCMDEYRRRRRQEMQSRQMARRKELVPLVRERTGAIGKGRRGGSANGWERWRVVGRSSGLICEVGR